MTQQQWYDHGRLLQMRYADFDVLVQFRRVLLLQQVAISSCCLWRSMTQQQQPQQHVCDCTHFLHHVYGQPWQYQQLVCETGRAQLSIRCDDSVQPNLWCCLSLYIKPAASYHVVRECRRISYCCVAAPICADQPHTTSLEWSWLTCTELMTAAVWDLPAMEFNKSSTFTSS